MTSINIDDVPPRDRKTHLKLLSSLMVEAFQTERSAKVHCEREAHRLGDVPPSAGLMACSRHAAIALDELELLAGKQNIGLARLGMLVGSAFSAVRSLALDWLIESQKSYRGTLLGLRHGVDVMRTLLHTADACGRVELSGFCTRWLAEREPAIELVERSLTWFAQHPEEALRRRAVAHGEAKMEAHANP